MSEHEELTALRAENARLRTLLEAHGIDWRLSVAVPPESESIRSRLSTAEKIRLFRRLFRGRTDVYPVRWESRSTGKSGYAPACGNEWKEGLCDKPRIKCADCRHRLLMEVSDQVIHDHLSGLHTVGVYVLLEDDTCHFLAIDFDDSDWREDARAFMQSCDILGVPAALEISRSGQGAHVWVFFSAPVPARDARRLGTALISHACRRTRQLRLASYDRLFPNQDTMPKGGFGNLIALPLQKQPRENGHSVFVDAHWQPCPDQWAYLSALKTMPPHDLDPVILRATGGIHPLDVSFIDDEDLAVPWQRRTGQSPLEGRLPASVSLTLANLIYIEKQGLPQSLINRLIRLAAFPNPEFYKAQAMRMSVWDKPRIIGCAQNYPWHIGLPRGCLDAVRTLLLDNGIEGVLQDERCNGSPTSFRFIGTLRDDQEAAVLAMLRHDFGVLCAPTAFGKTVIAAAMIARRGVNTLVLVHRGELLRQWQERLQVFLGVGKESIGGIGGGRTQLTGRIDIAMMQSLSRQGEVDPLVEGYGQIMIDECHHVGAASFDAILKRAKARFVLGLTATPMRRDGLQPIIFLQCGPVRHTAARQACAPRDLVVLPRFQPVCERLAAITGIQEVFRYLAQDSIRTQAVAAQAAAAFASGRKVLLLTERTDHLDSIASALTGQGLDPLVLHGRMSRKQRSAFAAQLEALPTEAARIVLATGKLVGEGFDHPALDTLVLAMPISWKGTLQQYAGRLHREQAGKTDVRIIDFVDTGHPALLRMWSRRQSGYRSMGYRIDARHTPTDDLFCPDEKLASQAGSHFVDQVG